MNGTAVEHGHSDRDVTRAVAAFQDQGNFFFWGAGRDTQLRLLGHLVRYSDLLLVLTAPAGAGKTALIRAFMQSDTTGLNTWLQQAQEFMRADALWAQLCASADRLKRSLGAAPAGRVEALRELAAECQSDGTVGVLIVDDAHLLAEDALEFLADASVALKDTDAMRIVLAGEPELQDHLEHSRLIDRMQGNCHRLTLDPFDAACAEDYLGQRLGSHGMTVDLFSESELAYVLKQGRGLPGEIGAAAVRVLRGGIPDGGSRNFPVIPRAHLLAIAAVLLLILGTYLFSGDEQPVAEDGSGFLEQPAVKRITAPKIVTARPELDREFRAGDGLSALPVAEQAALAPIPSGPEAKPQVTGNTEERSDPVPGSVEPSEQQVAPQSADDAPRPSTPPEPSQAQANAAAAEQPRTEQVSTLAPDILSSPDPAVESTPSPERERMESFLEGRKPQQRTEQWLLEQNPGSYTVQVLGASNEQAVAKFIADQEQPQDFIYFRTTLKGRDWFVVVIGLFSNRAEAVASIRSLPQALRKNRPWARSLESIHKAMLEDRPS